MTPLKCPTCGVDIDHHDANRCLDAWVARTVLELPVSESLVVLDNYGWPRERKSNFSSDIAAAWEVVEKLAEWNAIVSVAWGNGRDGRKYSSVQIAPDLFKSLTRSLLEMDGKALSAPLAICRAAVRATEGSKQRCRL